MIESPAYCKDRAREHREAAEATPLTNVRQKHLQAADTWERMAARKPSLGRHMDTQPEDESSESRQPHPKVLDS